MGPIQAVNDTNYQEFLNQDKVALVLTTSTCGNCANYSAEIEALLAKGELEGLAVGKVILDKGGSARLKRANPWIKDLEFLPYTVLYRHGAKVEEFAASKGSYLKLKVNLALA